MSDKTLKKYNNVTAGELNDVTTHPDTVPEGKIWTLKFFTAGDINLGDGVSSVFAIRYNGEFLRFFIYTGNSSRVPLNIDIEGVTGGTEAIEVIRQNYSSHTKRLPFVLEMYERS